MGTPTKEKIIDKASAFVRKQWPFLAIIFLWFIFSSPYFLKGLMPFPSKNLVTFFPPWNAIYGMPVKNNAMPDVITQIYPWKKLTIETWKKGEIPLWNPYSFSGTPQAGNYQSAVFSPFNLLFFVLPFNDAWSMLILLQPLLAGVFMFVFLRSMNRTHEASFFGSVAFMFCGFIVVWMAYGTLAYAALWLPLILFCIHSHLQKPSWWKLVLLSLSLALSFVSGHFQISIYIASVSFLFLIFECFYQNKLHQGVSLIFFYALGIVIALPQIVPAYNAYLFSFRSTSFSKGEIIPFQYLITLFSPDFFGNPVTRNDWFGHYAEWSSFIGVLPLLLAVYSMLQKTQKIVLFFSIAVIVTLLLATPTIFNDILFVSKIPVLSTSAASRVIILTSFSLSVLSAFGLDLLKQDWKKGNWKKTFFFFGIIFLLLILFWSFLVLKKPLDLEKLVVAKRNLVFPSFLAIFGIIICVTGLIKSKVIRNSLIILLLVVSSFDSLRFAMKWMPFDPKQFVYPEMPVIKVLKNNVGLSRVVGNFGGELSIPFEIQSIEGYDAVYQERYGEFMQAISSGKVNQPGRSVVNFDKHGKYSEQLLALIGVRFILHRLSDDHVGWTYPIWQYSNYHSIYKDNVYEIYENTNAYPRAFFASSYEIYTAKQDIIDHLFTGNFNRNDRIILESEPTIKPERGPGSVAITKYSPTKIDFSINTNVNKLLFLSDVYDSGWKAFVDGKRIPVYRADFDFRAIPVVAGSHLVSLVYLPDSFLVSAYISVTILLVLLLVSAGKIYYAHRFL